MTFRTAAVRVETHPSISRMCLGASLRRSTGGGLDRLCDPARRFSFGKYNSPAASHRVVSGQVQSSCGGVESRHAPCLTASVTGNSREPVDGGRANTGRPVRRRPAGVASGPHDSFAVDALDRPRSRSSKHLGIQQSAGAGCNLHSTSLRGKSWPHHYRLRANTPAKSSRVPAMSDNRHSRRLQHLANGCPT